MKALAFFSSIFFYENQVVRNEVTIFLAKVFIVDDYRKI